MYTYKLYNCSYACTCIINYTCTCIIYKVHMTYDSPYQMVHVRPE